MSDINSLQTPNTSLINVLMIKIIENVAFTKIGQFILRKSDSILLTTEQTIQWLHPKG